VLFNLAMRMTRNREDARDLTQSVFLKAYRGLKGFDPHRRFYSWLYRIMLNEGLNLLGTRREHEPVSEALPDTAATPEDELSSAEVERMVQAALQKLNTEHRQVIVLRHFLQLSYEEIGDVLEIPAKTVKSRLFTARQNLVPILQRMGVHSA
jgi:RNA polymerase sigma-70 factor, ECF subfamily